VAHRQDVLVSGQNKSLVLLVDEARKPSRMRAPMSWRAVSERSCEWSIIG